MIQQTSGGDMLSKIMSDNEVFEHFVLDQEVDVGLSESKVAVVLDLASVQKRLLKAQKETVEISFFSNIAPKVFGHVDWLPEIRTSGQYGSWNWLLMEYLPTDLPRERFDGDITDPDVIQKILDHIEAQPPSLKRATATQSQNML